MQGLLIFIVATSVIAESDNLLPSLKGAQETKWGEYPAVVSIITSLSTKGCTGHIIDSRHILTLAQCVIDQNYELQNPFWYRVIAGDINLHDQMIYRTERNVTHIFVHNEYNPRTLENDLAVLRIDVEFELPHNTIEPAILNEKIVPVGQSNSCFFVGWGSNEKELVIQQSFIENIYDRDICNNDYYPGHVFESVLCTMSSGRVCSDNLGGGLYCNGELTGIMSYSHDCETETPRIYTQIRFFTNWIQYQLKRIDNPRKRTSPIKYN